MFISPKMYTINGFNYFQYTIYHVYMEELISRLLCLLQTNAIPTNEIIITPHLKREEISVLPGIDFSFDDFKNQIISKKIDKLSFCGTLETEPVSIVLDFMENTIALGIDKEKCRNKETVQIRDELITSLNLTTYAKDVWERDWKRFLLV